MQQKHLNGSGQVFKLVGRTAAGVVVAQETVIGTAWWKVIQVKASWESSGLTVEIQEPA